MKLSTFLILIHFMNSQATEIHNSIDIDIEASYSKSILHKSTNQKIDRDLLISIILHSKWSDFNSIIRNVQ